MPELMNFCLVYPQAQNLPDIVECIDILSSACPSWFGKPKEAFFLNWETGVQYKLPWPPASPVELPELKNALICTYANCMVNEGNCRNCLSVIADEGSTVYTVCAPMQKVVSLPLHEVENWIGELFAALSHFAVPIIGVGSELGLETAPDRIAAVAQATSWSHNAVWVVADDSSLPEIPDGFIQVRQMQGSVLLRRTASEFLFPTQGG